MPTANSDRVLGTQCVCPKFLQQTICIALTVLLFGPASLTLADEEKTESGDGQLAPDAPVAASDEGLQAMGSFRKPEGWIVSLFAAEPALANPVAMTVDNRGRVFICESFRQDRGVTDNRGHNNEWLMADLAAQSVQDRIEYHKRLLGSEVAEYTAHEDRIRMLVDTDGDGKVDRDTVFAGGFNQLEEGTGAGILVRGDQAYYSCIPKLWSLTDSDGDGVAEERQVLHDGYGVRVAFRGHDSHGLIIGPDGRLYFSIGDRGYNIETEAGRLKNPESGAVFRCELDGSNLEVFATGLRNPQELAFDDYGYLFTGDNNSDSGDKARWVNVMQGGDSGWRMMYQYIPDRGPFNREKIWHPYSKETPAYIVPPIENISDGPSGLACYPGTGLTGDFANCFFLVDFRGGPSNSGIRLIRTQPKGAFWEVERSEEPIWNILATDATFGPDGALWVCDWVDGWVGEGKGRIYRFADPEAQKQDVVGEVQQLLALGFAERTNAELAGLLRHIDRRIRLEAQWELATRGEILGFGDLVGDVAAGTLPRMHAVWGLGQAARLKPALRNEIEQSLRQAIASDDLDVRAAAASVIGDLRMKRFSSEIVQMIGDAEPRVQYAACLAAGHLRVDDSMDAVVKLLADNADADPGLRHAGIMALKGVSDANELILLAGNPSPSVRVAAVVALRKLNHLGIVEFLTDAEPAVRLEAARAIHDVPALHAVLPALADLPVGSDSSNALVHRVLNANFRLAGPKSLEKITSIAADPNASQEMRVEALKMLATWREPGKLDRVMNRFMPIENRDDQLAKQAFVSKLPEVFSGSARVVDEAIAASATLGISQAAETLARLAEDSSNDASQRSAALEGLVRIQGEQALALVQRLVKDDQAVVRATALLLLTKLAPEAAVPILQEAIEAKDTEERQAAWDALANIDLAESTAIIEEGLRRYIAGGLPPDVWLNVVEAAEGRVDAELQQKLEEFNSQVAGNDPLEAYRVAIFGGNVKRGENLFFNKTELSCVRCHKVGETGGEVGPTLTEIGKTKDNRYLLESIVNPDGKIAENYETVVLLTEDDEIVTGVLHKETPSVIELIDANGKILEVDPLDVVSRKKGKSAMPADLFKSLSRRELRDLVAYLSSLK